MPVEWAQRVVVSNVKVNGNATTCSCYRSVKLPENWCDGGGQETGKQTLQYSNG